MVLVRRPGKCHAGGAKRCMHRYLRRWSSQIREHYSELLPKNIAGFLVVTAFGWGRLFWGPSACNGTLIPKQVHKILTEILRIFGIFCAQWNLRLFSLLRCLAGCSTSLSRLSPWWATRNVARTWRRHDKWVGVNAMMIPEVWMTIALISVTSWLVKGGGYPKMW